MENLDLDEKTRRDFREVAINTQISALKSLLTPEQIEEYNQFVLRSKSARIASLEDPSPQLLRYFDDLFDGVLL